jgi:hypothetical protein
MADIAKIKPAPRYIKINNPGNGKYEGITVELVSLDDEKMNEKRRQIADRRIHLEQRGKTFSAAQLENNHHDVLFNAMNGWTWENDADGVPATFNGEVPQFTRDNVIAVFKELPWFAKIIAKETGDDEAFFGYSKPI